MTFLVAIAALTLVALYLRLPGVDPPSLWLDDEWVAIVVRQMGFADFFRLHPPVPIGFVAVEKLAACLSKDPEWPLQLFPFACSLAQVPLMAALALAVTRRRSLAAFAAAFVAVSPMSIELSVRVKQYGVDGLVVIVLLLSGVPLLARWRRHGAVAWALMATLAVGFSFPSVFISVPILHVAALLHWRRRRTGQRLDLPSVAVVVAFNLSLALMWATMLRGQSSQAMKDYWSAGYMPTDVGAALHFLQRSGWNAVRTAFPQVLAPLLALIPLGLLDLALRPRQRGLALVLMLFSVECICASALRLYPIGGGRTDSFAHPVIILSVASGLSFLARCVARRPANTRRARSAITIASALAALALARCVGSPAAYPESGDADIVRAARELIRPGDALIIYPHGTIGVGYYSGWPIRFIPWPDYAHNFHVVITRPETLSLSPRGAYWANPASVQQELEAFLATPHARILYIAASMVHPRPHALIVEQLRRHGYRVEQDLRSGGSELLVLTPRQP